MMIKNDDEFREKHKKLLFVRVPVFTYPHPKYKNKRWSRAPLTQKFGRDPNESKDDDDVRKEEEYEEEDDDHE